MPRERSRDGDRRKFWRGMIGGQARSGLSISAWCRRQSLSKPSFYWWRRQLAGTDRRRKAGATNLTKAGAPQPTLVPVRVSASEAVSAGSSIEFVLSGGRRIRLRGRVDRQMLADLLAVSRSCRSGARNGHCSMADPARAGQGGHRGHDPGDRGERMTRTMASRRRVAIAVLRAF